MRPPCAPRLLLALLVALSLAGCVERKFVIRSEPEGATVLVNGAIAGTTPAEFPFHHYGTVRLELLPLDADGDGWVDYRRQVLQHDLDSPWYQWFPIDFFSDNLLPWTVEDVHQRFVVLEPALRPGVEADEELMRERAGTLRVRAERTRFEEEARPPEEEAK